MSLAAEAEAELAAEAAAYAEVARAALQAAYRDRPYLLTAHHLHSFDEFVDTGMASIIRSMNPLQMPAKEGVGAEVELVVGGKHVYLDQPTLVDPRDGSVRPLLPNEARLRDLTYSANLYADVVVRCRDSPAAEWQAVEFDAPVHIGTLPIMLHSRACLLHGLGPEAARTLGECPHDRGGYFVIDGREKVMITQEAPVANRLYVLPAEASNPDVEFKAFIRATSSAMDVFPRTTTFRVRSRAASSRPGTIGVVVTHIGLRDKTEVPLFVLFRALGVESDRAILDLILAGDRLEESADLAQLMRPCITEAAQLGVFDQRGAVRHMAPLTQRGTAVALKQVLMDDLFPNVGQDFEPKARMLGLLVRRIARVMLGKAACDEKDDYTNRRLLASGPLFTDLFRDVYLLLRRHCILRLDREFYSGVWRARGDLRAMVNAGNLPSILPASLVRDQLLQSMKGAWGVREDDPLAKDAGDEGVVQDLNRISYLGYTAHVRRVNNPMDRSLKLREPHYLLGSHYGAVCPVDSPDGPNIGLLKHLALLCELSLPSDPAPLVQHLVRAGLLRPPPSAPASASTSAPTSAPPVPVLVNGTAVQGGLCAANPPALVAHVRALRRAGCVARDLSVAWLVQEQVLHILTDRGRCCRPLVRVDPATRRPALLDLPGGGGAKAVRSWAGLFGSTSGKPLPAGEWPLPGDAVGMEALHRAAGPLELVDTEELRTLLVAMSPADIARRPLDRFTHCELHPGTMLGAVASTYPMLDHNNANYNTLCIAQFKQAVGVYATNFGARMDTLGLVLDHPQLPCVITEFGAQLCGGMHAHGENVLIAVATYSGYNQEDSVILNHDAVQRGRLSLTHFATLRAREELGEAAAAELLLANPLELEAAGLGPVQRLRPDAYGALDRNGMPIPGTRVHEGQVLVGRVLAEKKPASSSSSSAAAVTTYTDASKVAGRGDAGTVDRVFLYPAANSRDGARQVKIRMREQRAPELGDKLASRFGQKGVVGMLLPARDMPFGHTSGLVPDVIINPHGFPKRATVAHLLEALLAKGGAVAGARPLVNNFEERDLAGEAAGVLQARGFHRYGSEVLYNGRTGEQISCDIFVGVNYYGRLKHMVADKYQSRTRGPRNAIVRQPTKTLGGGSGGLRIGEMEQHALLAHGVASFIKESFMDRSDRYRGAHDAGTGVPAEAFDARTGAARATPFGDARDAAPPMFHEVETPYAFKLLQQELQAMGLDMRAEHANDIVRAASLPTVSEASDDGSDASDVASSGGDGSSSSDSDSEDGMFEEEDAAEDQPAVSREDGDDAGEEFRGM